jgi:hypothetical protein
MATVSLDELDDKRPPNNSVSLVTRNAVRFSVFYVSGDPRVTHLPGEFVEEMSEARDRSISRSSLQHYRNARRRTAIISCRHP